MNILSKLFKGSDPRNWPYLVIRISRQGHHYYSILAWDGNFEFVFQNGHDSWSTVSPSLANRIREMNVEGIIGNSLAKSKESFVEIATIGTQDTGSSWLKSAPIFYDSKEEALKIERAVLDKSWATNEER
jgi:hypothetical protein